MSSISFNKAVITAAKRSQRQLPLQTVINREGETCTALQILLQEIRDSGIEEVAIVIAPGDEELYRAAAGEAAGDLRYLVQPEPRGYGDAVLQARDFVGHDGFLLMVSDHLHLSDDPHHSCAAQLRGIAEELQCCVSAVQPTHESKLCYFGTIGGMLHEGRSGIYQVARIVEKPTPTLAEQELLVPGLRMAHYLCFLGIHALTSRVMDLLTEASGHLAPGAVLGLTPCLHDLATREQYLAAEIRGRRYDLEDRYGLLKAQLAIALDGRNREEILTHIVSLLAESPVRS